MNDLSAIDPNDMNESDLPISRRARRSLAPQRLTVTDVLIVLSNSAARRHGHKLNYHFDYLDDSPASQQRRAIGRAAGLERVKVVFDLARKQVTKVRRARRRFVPSPRPGAWTAAFRLTAMPATLRLTRHAEERLRQRQLTREDLVVVIRHGRCLHRAGQVYYAMVGRELREAAPAVWARLNGVVVVVCADTTTIVTAWRGHDETHRRLRRKPAQRRWPQPGRDAGRASSY